MGRNKNNEVKVVAQAKQGREAVPDIDDPNLGNDSDDDDDEESKQPPAQSLEDFLDAPEEEEKKERRKQPKPEI